MSIAGERDNAVVIRVVYDGPPMAGKTTSVAALAQKLGGHMETPAEIDGRTLYFDWLDYTGGLFEGRAIRCQIVTVPGQGSLASRRRLLLESGDAVVFVAEGTRNGLAQSRTYLNSLRSVLRKRDGVPVGIVLQANRRDSPDAVDLSDLREELSLVDPATALVESVATTGTGVREAFVLAVRLALDRVRERAHLAHPPSRQLAAESADELMTALEESEQGALALAASSLAQSPLDDAASEFRPDAESATETQAREASSPADRRSDNVVPLLPNSALPSGMIWPPVEGRVMLHEATVEGFSEPCNENGWQMTSGSGWTVHSPAEACFDSVQVGRAALLDWARAHSARSGLFAQRRCIVLAEDGLGHYRLWQCVGAAETMLDRLMADLEKDPESVSALLIDIARQLVRGTNSEYSGLPLDLASIAARTGQRYFAGLMPYPFDADGCPAEDQSLVDRFATELAAAKPQLLEMREALREQFANYCRGREPEAAYAVVGHYLESLV